MLLDLEEKLEDVENLMRDKALKLKSKKQLRDSVNHLTDRVKTLPKANGLTS